jgi:sulfane dehydrogenase subunit SoxC
MCWLHRVIYALLSNRGCAMTEPTDTDRDITETSRRRFLRDGGALVGGAVIAGGLGGSQALAAANAGNLPPNVPEWMKTPGDPMGSQPYGTLRRSRRML